MEEETYLFFRASDRARPHFGGIGTCKFGRLGGVTGYIGFYGMG